MATRRGGDWNGPQNRARGSEHTTERLSGVITKIVSDRGFGFIKDERGYEFFFHRSACRSFTDLTPGTRVTFVRGDGVKGPRAEQIEVV